MTMQAEAEAGVAVQAQLSLNLGRLADELAYQREYKRKLSQSVHPFTIPPVPMTLVSSAGTLNQPNLLGPQLSNIWVVHRIACTGFTVGTVIAYLNAVGAEEVAVFTAANSTAPNPSYFGKGQITLTGNDNLVFSATGITGTVAVSIAGVEIAADMTGEYFV